MSYHSNNDYLHNALYPRLLGVLLSTFKALMCFPLLIPFVFAKNRDIIHADWQRWARVLKLQQTGYLLFLKLLVNPVFRTLYYHRLKYGGMAAYALSKFIKIVYRPISSLVIYTKDIGPGLYIEHGVATVIAAQRIGANCWINQQVTIGFADSDAPADAAPTLGEGVRVHCGAKVLGKIIVGDFSRIGANAVVVRNVPAGCTVAGVPAKVIRRDGIRVNQIL